VLYWRYLTSQPPSIPALTTLTLDPWTSFGKRMEPEPKLVNHPNQAIAEAIALKRRLPEKGRNPCPNFETKFLLADFWSMPSSTNRRTATCEKMVYVSLIQKANASNLWLCLENHIPQSKWERQPKQQQPLNSQSANPQFQCSTHCIFFMRFLGWQSHFTAWPCRPLTTK